MDYDCLAEDRPRIDRTDGSEDGEEVSTKTILQHQRVLIRKTVLILNKHFFCYSITYNVLLFI